jgi:hypothetical protein
VIKKKPAAKKPLEDAGQCSTRRDALTEGLLQQLQKTAKKKPIQKKKNEELYTDDDQSDLQPLLLVVDGDELVGCRLPKILALLLAVAIGDVPENLSTLRSCGAGTCCSFGNGKAEARVVVEKYTDLIIFGLAAVHRVCVPSPQLVRKVAPIYF